MSQLAQFQHSPVAGKAGRPPVFDRELMVEKIITELEKGTPLSAICREPRMPSRRLVDDWSRDHEDIRTKIARARLLGEETVLEQVIRIADDIKGDPDPASRKVRVWARMEFLKRFNPKRWGDQAAAAPAVNVEVAVNVMTAEKIADLAARKRVSIERRKRAESLNPATLPTLPDLGQSQGENGQGLP